jgi:mono/diheme cytochrome c family protein
MKNFFRNDRGSVLAVLTMLFVTCFSVLFLYVLYRGGAEAVIGGKGNLTNTSNPHNLSAGSTRAIKAVSEDRICVFCHTPHNAISNSEDPDLINPPLWNHELSSETYVLHSAMSNLTNTVDSTVYNVTLLAQPVQPDGTSKLCLSCHDGTVSIGAVRSVVGNIAMVTSTSCLDSDGSLGSSCTGYIGNDLTTKHVVSIPMNDALISNSIANCTNGFQTYNVQFPWNSSVTDIEQKVFLRPTKATYGGPGIDGGDAAIPASLVNSYKAGYNYGVQCSTCHDPHYWGSGDSSPRQELEAFLVADENDLCNACHELCP